MLRVIKHSPTGGCVSKGLLGKIIFALACGVARPIQQAFANELHGNLLSAFARGAACNLALAHRGLRVKLLGALA